MASKFIKLKLEELNRVSPEKYAETSKIPLILILDNIRSLNNIGSLFRTADAFRVEAIWLSGYTAQPPHREIQKTALGATETINWRHFNKPEEVIKELRQMDYDLIAVEQSTNSIMLDDFQIENNSGIAVVMGNEVDGVSLEYMNTTKSVIEIPQEGTKHSLNVSVAAGIVLYNLFNQYSNTI